MGHGAPASRRATPLSTAPVPHNAIFGGFCAGVVQRRFRTIRANSSDHWKMAVPEFLFVAIPAQKRVEIALCGKRCATQCDFDAKYRWCGNVGTQVTIRRIAEDDHPQSLRDSSPGPASGDGLRPRASRIALAYKQFPLFVGECNPRGGGATCRFCSWAWRNRWGNRARKGPRRPLRGSRRAWRPSRHCRCTA